MISLNDKNFSDTAIGSEKFCVMFHADFSGPCRLVKPTFVSISDSVDDGTVFGEFSISDNTKIPKKFGVKGVPLFGIFRNGVLVDSIVGAISEKRLREFIRDG